MRDLYKEPGGYWTMADTQFGHYNSARRWGYLYALETQNQNPLVKNEGEWESASCKKHVIGTRLDEIVRKFMGQKVRDLHEK